MKRGLVLGVLVLVGGLTAGVRAFYAPPAQQAPAPTPSASALEVDKLRDNLFVLRGGGGNTAVFVQANGVTLVDTKNPGWGTPIIEKVKELTNKPVTMIINTHTHQDHTSGNVEFPATVEVVTHENTARLMQEGNPVTSLQTERPRNYFKENNGRGLPKRTFKDRMTVGSGNDRIELHYFGRAHTSGDAFVVFPVARVLHTGDVFPNKGMPIMDANNGGSGVEYSGTVAKAATLPNIDTVITGHNATTLTMADVREYGEFVGDFVRSVQAAKKSGKGSVDEIAKTWKVPGRFKGYAQPAEARLRAMAQVVWDETK